jgi:hypothetical protein
MTLDEAAKQGIAHLRKPVWADPHDYILIDLFDEGTRGPWLHLYAPVQKTLGYPSPQNILGLSDTGSDWVPYTGPLHERDMT